MSEGFKTGFFKNEFNNEFFRGLGIMRARVEYHNDPKRIGRVKVRIPSIHGMKGLTQEWLEIDDLPWAYPCFAGGVGQDFGQFIPPVPGTFVWVMFEDNDRDKPVYLGGIPSGAHSIPRLMNNLVGEESPLRKWSTKLGVADTPFEIFNGKSTGIPERFCVYKSQKGNAIIYDDTDGEEALSIIDRVGQIIKFNAPVSKGDNEGGYFRGADSAENNRQLDKAIDPSILIKTGPSVSGTIHSTWQLWQNRFHAEYIDTTSSSKTTTDAKNDSFIQRTKDSILIMLEKSITLTYPEIVEYMCDDYFYIKAFGINNLFMDKSQCYLTFKDNGMYINDEHLLLKFNDATIEMKDDGIYINGKKIEMTAEEDIKGTAGKNAELEAGENYSLDAGGSFVKSEDGKTKIKGEEVHLN